MASHPPPLGDAFWRGRVYWACQSAGWGAVTALNVAFAVVTAPASAGSYMLIYLWAGCTALALTHGWRAFLRRSGWMGRDAHPAWVRLALVIPLLGLAQTLMAALGFLALQPPGSFKSWAWLPVATVFWTVAIIVWTALYGLALSLRRSRRLEKETLQLAVHAKESELHALQLQINPHFYFNSLNSLRALIFADPAAAAGMVDQLAALMRYALQSSRLALVPLSSELDAVGQYLAIEKIRFEERLRISYDIAPDLDDVRVPPMTLQTLVENAVKYGVEHRSTGSVVRIGAARDGNVVEITVANEGQLVAGADSTKLGLENARRRLALSLGEGATLALSQSGGWVRAAVRIPVAI